MATISVGCNEVIITVGEQGPTGPRPIITDADGNILTYDDTEVRGLITNLDNRVDSLAEMLASLAENGTGSGSGGTFDPTSLIQSIAAVDAKTVSNTTAIASLAASIPAPFNPSALQNSINSLNTRIDNLPTPYDPAPVNTRLTAAEQAIQVAQARADNAFALATGTGEVSEYDDTQIRQLITANAQNISGLADEVFELTNRPEYDDSALVQRVDDLEASIPVAFDPTTINNRLTTLEQTVTSLPRFSDIPDEYDDTTVNARIDNLQESIPDEYNDTEVRERISALETTVNAPPVQLAISDISGLTQLLAQMQAAIDAMSSVTPATAPAMFGTNDWSVSTGLQTSQIALMINNLPASGGSPITALQYFVNNQWVTMEGLGTGSRILTMPQADALYNFRVRAVNAVNPGQESNIKSARSGAAPVVNPVDSTTVFHYQNSLLDHQYNGNADDDTRVPNWAYRMALASGKDYKASGKFGFAYQWELPPDAALMYGDAPTPDDTPMWTATWEGKENFDMVVFVPDNFDSFDRGPDVDSTNPDGPVRGTNYVDRILEVVDAWEANAPLQGGKKRRYCVYSGWADFKPASGGGDWDTYTPAQLQTYLDWSFGDYQDWYVQLVDLLKAARPNLEIELIDVQRVMMDTWQNTPLSALSGSRLWEDNSPHGTETWYLLAALVYYMEVFKEKPIAGYDPISGLGAGSGVDPVMLNNWQIIVDYAWDALGNVDVVDPEAPVARSTGLTAVGLGGISDYGVSQPFINVLKSARGWEGRSSSQFTSHTTDQLRSGGHLDADGNPIRIPSGANRVGTIILTEIRESDLSMTGRFRLSWTGDGDVNVSGGAQNLTFGSGFLEFDYNPNGSNLVLVDLTRISSVDPIKLTSCVQVKHAADYAAGEIFRPEWLDVIRPFRLFRFMDWQATNNSTLSAWGNRPRVENPTWAIGVPVEIMVELCNKLGVDAWFCMPHLATEDYITQFAQYVRENLNSNLVAYYEYSNEVWNWQFQQAQWANDQAAALWPDYLNQDGWMQFYGGKVARMSELVDAAYSGVTGRHRKVITTQTGYNGLEHPILNAPRWVAMEAGRQAPKEYVDELAVTSYFGHSLSGTQGMTTIQNWRNEFGNSGAITRMNTEMNAEIDNLVLSWNYLKPIADAAGLGMVMYEGGSHIVPDNSFISGSGPNYDATLFPFLESYHYSTDMGELYTRAMTEFAEAGGSFFNVFVEMDRPSTHGFWGGLRNVSDSNPRWNAVLAYNAGNPIEPAFYPELEPNMLRPGEILVSYYDPQPIYQITPDWFNGVLTQGNPDLITWNDDDSIVLNAQFMNNDKRTATLNQPIWNSGKTQIIKPQRGKGRWQWISSSENANAVLAMFTYASEHNAQGIGNGSELDFEYIINNDSNRGAVGARGFLLSVHMPQMTDPGVRNSRSLFVPFTVDQWLVPTLFEIDHDETRTQWYIDGEMVGEITAASMPAGTRWTTTAVMEQFSSVERHAAWAGWTNYTTASMKVWGIKPPAAPTIPAPTPASSISDSETGFIIQT